MKDVICIFADSWHIAKKHNFSAVVINTAGAPGSDPESVEMLEIMHKRYGSKFIFTNGSNIGNDEYMRNLKDTVGENNVELLHLPVIPTVTANNNFNKKIILWPHRTFLLIHQAEPDHNVLAGYQKMLTWIAERLEEDLDMEFHVMTGWDKADRDFHKVPDVEETLFSNDFMKGLRKFRNRIKIHPGLSWDKAMDMYAKAKVTVGFCGPRGNSIIEAAAHGIPAIGQEFTGSLIYCSNYLGADFATDKYFSLLNRLYTDKELYTFTLESYKEYIETHQTYTAFVDNLLEILERRDMI